ncbi:MAG: DUF4123 domain-containing protein [Pseudomonadota bacterium]
MMVQYDGGIQAFSECARKDRKMNWYAIADCAQHPALPDALISHNERMRCLFNSASGSPVAKFSPCLIELSMPTEDGAKAWDWIRRNARAKPCISILASKENFNEVFSSLATCIDVILPDGENMYLAFWDPAILGTIMGQESDLTLHVKGPALQPYQRASICAHISHWWYWDRSGVMHSVAVEQYAALCGRSPFAPIHLDQTQVDMLVEASLPDQIISYLQDNLPLLIGDGTPVLNYEKVRNALLKARELNLTTMSELVNFISLQLNYGEDFENNPDIRQLLDQVRGGKLNFYAAMHNFP